MFIDHKLKKVKKLGQVAIVRFYQACHLKIPLAFIKTVYRIVGKFGKGIKFGEFGKSSMIRQTKTIQISIYN